MEQQRRRAVMMRIFETCKRLLVQISTSITALVTAHRYINFISTEVFFKRSENAQVAAICFLSCKLDEDPRSLRDVVSVVRKIYGDAKVKPVSTWKEDLYQEEKEYPAIRDAVISVEQVILRATGFETQTDIPHKYLLNMARALCLSCPVVEYAYALLNDSFFNQHCLEVRPMALSCACLHLGILYVSHEYPQSTGDVASSDKSDSLLSGHPPDDNADIVTLPIRLSPMTSTTRACLKSPCHDLHAALKAKWWNDYFSVDDNEFLSAVMFVTQNVSNDESIS